ncbi:MAG: type II secretion system F family protein [Deltaproteobacteria bacterium]|nr:MAG: type II secretion system F family protein [Deltaproteobacteria bacterium]
MGAFVWEGRTRSGEVRNGVMEAKNAAEVEQRLRSMGLVPEKVKKKPIEIKLPRIGGVSLKDLVVFTRQFSTMIDAGLPLVQCLDILASQSENPTFKKVLEDIKSKVEEGSTFADALRRHPKVFDDLYVNMVAAGEIGGILDTILNRLAVYIEKSQALRKKVRGAMVYPICIVIVAIAVLLILLYYVIPVFEKMFEDFGAKQALPGPTQNLIDLSQWMRQNWYIVFGLLIGIPIGIHYFKKWPKGRELWDKMMLRLPLFGNLIRKTAVAKFTRTMGTLIASGVPILDAMQIVARSAGNKVVEDAIMYTREKVSEGKNMADPLAETKVFPGMVVQMIAVGESTGALDQMMQKIADFYDEEVDAAVEALTSMLEPMMLVLLGGMVGYFLVAMYLPIFNLASAVQA